MGELENLQVSATVIVISKDNKALIIQRPSDKAFPNLWSVAGGKVQETDGILVSEGFHYHSVEACARRELYEETGILIGEMSYLTSITTIWGPTRRIILSYFVILNSDAKDTKITLSECQDYKWIERHEISKYDFIPDIGGEIEEVFARLEQEYCDKMSENE